ncbi:hypothetical protein N5P37_004157 [Trichoderma harzianum]|nr:hypothetical protein N5P37_004157 [Trichoderma harzianum]
MPTPALLLPTRFISPKPLSSLFGHTTPCWGCRCFACYFTFAFALPCPVFCIAPPSLLHCFHEHLPSFIPSIIFVNPRLRSSGEVEKATRSPSRTVQYLVATTWEATTTRPLSSSRGSVLARQLSHPPLCPAATSLPADALRLYEPRTWHHPTNLPAHQRMSGRLGCLNIARFSCDYPSIESPASQPDVPNLYPSDRRAF